MPETLTPVPRWSGKDRRTAITVTVPESIRQRLMQLADERGDRMLSEVVTETLRRGLNQQP